MENLVKDLAYVFFSTEGAQVAQRMLVNTTVYGAPQAAMATFFI